MKHQKLFIFGTLLFLTSCDNPDKDLKNAEQINTEQAYQDFIQSHPDSPLVAQAQADLEKAAYAEAKSEGSPLAFEKFLNRFPKSSLVKEARVDLESAEFTCAGSNATIAGWRAFLEKYPDSPHTGAAISNLSELSFQAATDGNTEASLESFLKEFPISQQSAEATEKLAMLVWSDVSKSNTVSAYESFLSRFGRTSLAPRASNALARIDYQNAANSNTIEDYQKFLQLYPDSEFTADVKERLEPLLEERDWNQALLNAQAYYDQQDYEKAFISFYQAATNGSVIGQLNVGVMYRKGRGVQQNPDEAFKWLLKAAGATNAEAEYDVGVMLATGEGTQRDEAQAKQWVQKSADAGFSEAVEYLQNANLKPLTEGEFVGTANDGSELNITLEEVGDSIKVQRLGYKFAGSMRVANVSMPTKEPFGTFANNTLTFQFPVMISFAMQNFMSPSANVGVATYTALLKNDGTNVICELQRAGELLPEYESLRMEQISMEGQMPDGTRMLYEYQIILKPNGQ